MTELEKLKKELNWYKENYNTVCNICLLYTSCDPNKIMMDTIIKRNSVCPFCGENRFCTFKDELNAIKEGKKASGVRQICGVSHRRLGFQKPWYKHIFQGEKWWNSLLFKCETCGAEQMCIRDRSITLTQKEYEKLKENKSDRVKIIRTRRGLVWREYDRLTYEAENMDQEEKKLEVKNKKQELKAA